MLLLNNGRDHLCSIASVEDYVARSDGMAQLVSTENAGHFSIYSDRELRDRSYAEINRFLERHGFSQQPAPGGSPSPAKRDKTRRT